MTCRKTQPTNHVDLYANACAMSCVQMHICIYVCAEVQCTFLFLSSTDYFLFFNFVFYLLFKFWSKSLILPNGKKVLLYLLKFNQCSASTHTYTLTHVRSHARASVWQHNKKKTHVKNKTFIHIEMHLHTQIYTHIPILSSTCDVSQVLLSTPLSIFLIRWRLKVSC